MPYSEFTLKKMKNKFGLEIIENNIFGKIEPLEVSKELKNRLDENVPLALGIVTK